MRRPAGADPASIRVTARLPTVRWRWFTGGSPAPAPVAFAGPRTAWPRSSAGLRRSALRSPPGPALDTWGALGFVFGIDDFLWAHLIATAIGHLNHANLVLPLGPLRYVLNNPQMHIWHHSWELPEDRRHGINFGISLSCWDYLFGTARIPGDGRDIRLGFPGLEAFPGTFVGQQWPWSRG